MSSLGMSVVSRVKETDRFPFLKALAHIAAIDDSVSLDEKKMVMEFAEAWNLDDQVQEEVQDLLRSGTDLSLDALVEEFSETGTRFLLLQELIRLSHSDGTYGDAEREEIAQIAGRLDLSEKQLREVEMWVERGQAWESGDEDGPDTSDLEARLNRDEDSADHDLSDIPTGDADLSDLDESGLPEETSEEQ